MHQAAPEAPIRPATRLGVMKECTINLVKPAPQIVSEIAGAPVRANYFEGGLLYILRRRSLGL